MRHHKSHAATFVEGWESTENEIRHRLKDPSGYDKCRSKDLTDGVRAIFCHKTGGDAWEMQALRFDKAKFTAESAKAWVAKHGPFSESVPEPEGEDVQPMRESEIDLEVAETIAVGTPVDAQNRKWEVQMFAFGASKRPPHFVYTKETLANSAKAMERVDVYAHAQADDYGHRDTSKAVPRDKVGLVTQVHASEAGAVGVMHILPSAQWLHDNLVYAQANNLPAPYELSIRASGKAHQGDFEGKKLPIAESFHAVALDVVDRGAAGGQFVRMVASTPEPAPLSKPKQGDTKVKNKLLALFTIFYPTFLESKKVDVPNADENLLWTYLLEADKPQGRFNVPDGMELRESTIDGMLAQFKVSPATQSADPMSASNMPAALRTAIEAQKEELTKLKRQQCAQMLESELTASKLPKPWQEHIKSQYVGKIFDLSELQTSIKGIRETHSLFVGSVVDNRGMEMRMGEDAFDKKRLGLEGLFMLDPNRPHPEKDDKEIRESLKGIPPYRSIKQAYQDITGDVNMTGQAPADRRFTESLLTTDWTSIMAATMNRRMVRDYGLLGLDTWRAFVDVVSVNNFKQQERVRFGGYANLATVAQGGAYLPIVSPTDEKATYTPAKRGGTEDITLEMMTNDDVGSVTKIPQRMARAAAQTLHEFVYDFIYPNVNPVIYDTAVLYITAGGFPHANYGTAALGTDGVALAAARLRMKKQVMKDNSKRLGIRARYLVVPQDLETIAYGLCVPAYGQYNNVPTFLQYQGLVPIVVDYWTDLTDWCLVADRSDIVGLEVGFVNGQETPELFVSDIPNVGSYFTNDKITYKIRHIYGGAITDFRAFDGSVVA
jgi:hypothetical protein